MPRFDAIIVGAGPGGAVAALCLARAGAQVVMVDKRAFPRDKACGDLLGPRAVQLLADLKIEVPGARRVGDMILVGPNGWRTLLPAFPGLDYPGHALSVPRREFDATLFDAAIDAGAVYVHDRVTGLAGERHAPTGVRLASGTELLGDVIVGADGSASRIAEDAELVDDRRALWGFALRRYIPAPVELPHILLWEPERRQLFPGYGWIFPTPDGGANVGLGLAFGADRALARRAGAQFDDFLLHLVRAGLLPGSFDGAAGNLGGWLKMGAVGTDPAGRNVLLVGDAAGLINPLQGEGIAQAMASGRAAADAIVAGGPKHAADRYRGALHAMTRHQRLNAPVQAGIVAHPLAVSMTARVLTAPLVRNAVSGAWSLYWNDLVEGAHRTWHRRLAVGVGRAVRTATRRSAA